MRGTAPEAPRNFEEVQQRLIALGGQLDALRKDFDSYIDAVERRERNRAEDARQAKFEDGYAENFGHRRRED